MRKRQISILLIFCAFFAKLLAQEPPKSDLVFNKLVHDFGDILISEGKKSCSFTFTNTGSKPIVIQMVTAACGCTEPTWERAPIMPGKSGSIFVTFLNDQGPYPFEKTITVYPSDSDFPITLRIKGVAHDKKKSVSELFPVAYGPLRVRNTLFHLGQVAQGEAKTDSVQVVNNGRSTIEIGFSRVSKGLIISAHPQRLKAGEKGSIRYTIDTRLFNDWGAVTFTALPLINGRAEGAKPLEISADIRDNFRRYSQEQLAQAPILQADKTSARFENAKRGSKIEQSFSISNKGLTPLIIHKISTTAPSVTVKAPKEIAPGKSETISLIMDTSGVMGETIGGITLITNVPSRPSISFVVTGTVVP